MGVNNSFHLGMWEFSPKKELKDWVNERLCLPAVEIVSWRLLRWNFNVDSVEYLSLVWYMSLPCPQPPSEGYSIFRVSKRAKNRKPCDGREDGEYGRWSFHRFHWGNYSLWQFSTTEAVTMRSKTGMVLWIWNHHCIKKITIRTLGKGKTWATSPQSLQWRGDPQGWMGVERLAAQAGSHCSCPGLGRSWE